MVLLAIEIVATTGALVVEGRDNSGSSLLVESAGDRRCW